MRAAALQFDVSREDPDANLAAVSEGIEAARVGGVELVCLPEMWPTSFPTQGTDLEQALADTERLWSAVGELAEDAGLAIVGSGFARPDPDAAPTNRLRLLDGRRCVMQYDKVHLFTPTAEQESLSAGDQPPETVEVRGVPVSGLVCYDLRFPEICRVPFRDGCEVLCVCAQWPRPRAAHWRALVLGLAVSNQCFVVAANRTGIERVGRQGKEFVFPGNSLLVDPDGQILAEGQGESGLVMADLDLAVGRTARRRVPVLRDSRHPLYEQWLEADRGPG